MPQGMGGPPEKLDRIIGGPPLVAKMLIGTGTRYDPKGKPLADVWEQASELKREGFVPHQKLKT